MKSAAPKPEPKPDPIAEVKAKLATLDTENTNLLQQLQRSEAFASDLRGKIIGVQHSQKAFTELLKTLEPDAAKEPQKDTTTP
jgi:hypothetical protein